MERRKDLIAILILTVVILLFFLPVLVSGKTYFFRDIMFETYPLSSLIKESFETRTLPLWNPYIGYGQPLLAQPAAQVVYPTTLLRMLLPGQAAFLGHL